MTAEVKGKKEALPYNAQQRVQAVLSIWSERRRTREVCRELAIHPSALYACEKRALQAMLKAVGVDMQIQVVSSAAREQVPNPEPPQSRKPARRKAPKLPSVAQDSQPYSDLSSDPAPAQSPSE